jgi:hypothetical protein
LRLAVSAVYATVPAASLTSSDNTSRAASASRRIDRSHTPRDLGPAFTLDHSNVVLALQIKPELVTISKISAEPDGRICSDLAASIEYVGDTARWHAEIERKPVCAELARF